MTRHVDENYPIPSTQDKFNEADYFLMKMMEHYQNPWEFQFNLNAFIQAFRNITFMLQAEPNKPKEFEEWYLKKQEDMKANKLLRNFVQARNIVVKRSSLSSKSKAQLGLFRDRSLKLSIGTEVHPFSDSKQLLQKTQEIMIGSFLDEEHMAIGEQLGVERSWIVEEIGEDEVVSLCLEALNYMGNLISEAKELFGLKEEFQNIKLNLPLVQVLLESDVDPTLIEKWDW
ncbi:MAG: hypothetical protein M0Q02_07580 [Candidatus Muirbacterium halophilum]|jgi:hypothetical protein|nr:hypothetical protein [Candidatus Muirbacterium halophilum]MDX9796983.1 hypothetical protein [Arcobacteraceae bacterium]